MKLRSGSVPEELVYVYGRTKEITIKFDDVESEEGDVVVKETVIPTFVSDASNPKTIETARTWAKGYQKTNVKEVTRKNLPISKLKLMGLDYRGNGGRAWKVMDENNYYFDLREDVLLELTRSVGISPGGYLNGEYIWGKSNAEMKLVRVGSELHKAMLAVTARKALPRVGAKELLPGHLYQAKNGDVSFYVGKVKILTPKEAPKDGEDLLEYSRWAMTNKKGMYNFGYYGAPVHSKPSKPVPLNIPLVERSMGLWVRNIPWEDTRTLEKQTDTILKFLEAKDNITYVHIGPMEVVKDIGEISFQLDLSKMRADKWKEAIEFEAGIVRGYRAGYVNVNADPIVKERARVLHVVSLLAQGTAHLENETFDYEPWIILSLSREPKLS